MVTSAIEYIVVRQLGCGWTVLRDGAPIGRRRALTDALEFATQLAECEGKQGRCSTRVIMDRRDVADLPGCGPWPAAA
jgi:hypothetical protein